MNKTELIRCALVTGAGSGIGRAVAQRYAAAGMQVVGLDVSASGLDETRKLIGDSFHSVVGDVRSRSDLERASDLAGSVAGGVDVAACIAGVSRSGGVAEMDDETRDLILGVNLIGVWNTIAVTLASMRARGSGGRILVCGSIESVLANGNLAAYVASKHAVVGLVKAVALEVAAEGITANVISPAGVDTPMLAEAVGAEMVEYVARTTPAKRLSSPDEIASFFVALASPDAGYLTGQNVVVDGGLMLVNAHIPEH